MHGATVAAMLIINSTPTVNNTNMKSHQFALIIALLLPLGMTGSADAKPAGHSGTSSSFKSGFSSQKSSSGSTSKPSFGSFGAAKPAAPPVEAPSAAPSKQSSFGSFGKAAGTGADAAGAPAKSALTKDLDKNAANENALRTLDARKAAALPPAAPSPAPLQAAPQYGGPAPYQQPIIVQQRSGFGDMAIGFMLGHALSGSHSNGGYAGNNGAYPGNGQAGGVPVVEHSSFGATLLRTFLWLLILGSLGWLVYFVVRRFKRAKQDSAPNYSFERE